jgi:hypothetical protein
MNPVSHRAPHDVACTNRNHELEAPIDWLMVDRHTAAIVYRNVDRWHFVRLSLNQAIAAQLLPRGSHLCSMFYLPIAHERVRLNSIAELAEFMILFQARTRCAFKHSSQAGNIRVDVEIVLKRLAAH